MNTNSQNHLYLWICEELYSLIFKQGRNLTYRGTLKTFFLQIDKCLCDNKHGPSVVHFLAALRVLVSMHPWSIWNSASFQGLRFPKYISTTFVQFLCVLYPKTLEYRTGRKRFVYIFFQASSGIRMDQNKGFLPVLYSKVFDTNNQYLTRWDIFFMRDPRDIENCNKPRKICEI